MISHSVDVARCLTLSHNTSSVQFDTLLTNEVLTDCNVGTLPACQTMLQHRERCTKRNRTVDQLLTY